MATGCGSGRRSIALGDGPGPDHPGQSPAPRHQPGDQDRAPAVQCAESRLARRPLTRCETLVQCIASATTTGLTVHAEYDAGPYPTGIVVTDEAFHALHVTQDAFHGEWNYTITP